MKKTDELRGRYWAANLSTIERAALSQMSSRGNQMKLIRGTRNVQAGNTAVRQLRPTLNED